MKIQGRKNQPIGAVGPLGLPTPPAAPAEAEAPAPVADQVDLGSTAQVRRLQQALETLPAVRAEKVEGLRGQIDQGSYYVESDKLARKVVDEMLADVLLSDSRGEARG